MSYATKKSLREADHRRRDLAFGGISLTGSLVVGVYFAKALWALPCIAVLGYFACDYAMSFVALVISRRAVFNLAFAALFTFAIWSLYLREEYHAQMSAETEGDLEPLPARQKFDGVILQIGDDGPIFDRDEPGNIAPFVLPLENRQVAYDAGLEISNTPKGLEITTPVIDRDGNRVGEITANHWKVYPPYCSDKNYTKHSLEIKDKAGHVVLQVTLYRNEIHLQGEWHTSLGHGERLATGIPGYPGLGDITVWRKPEEERNHPFLIKPMFAYPSSHHWGELTAKQP